MKTRSKVFMSISLCGLIMLSGCAQGSSAKTNLRSKVPTSPTHISAISAHDATKINGSIISMTPIPTDSSGFNLYRMFYWSEGTKVEAYVAKPEALGTFPLFVDCHGGWSTDLDESHNTQWAWSLKYILFVLNAVPNDTIYLFPQYRGYGNSDGTIQGMVGIVQDINNAITAVQTFKDATPHDVYLFGASMGGGAVLQTAAERNDVKAVVALSPFLGADVFVKWYRKLRDPAEWNGYYTWYENTYGANTLSQQYVENSPYDHTETIHAPVLLLQGKDDHHVLWQSVQDYANKLTKEHKSVQLILFQNGNHCLTNDYYVAYSDIEEWFDNHGCNFNLY